MHLPPYPNLLQSTITQIISVEDFHKIGAYSSLAQEQAHDLPQHAEKRGREADVYRTDPYGERALDTCRHDLVELCVNLSSSAVIVTSDTLWNSRPYLALLYTETQQFLLAFNRNC